jgi:hypothetical protein
MYGRNAEIYEELYESSEKAQWTLSTDLSHWILDFSVDEYGHIPFYRGNGITGDDALKRI